MNNAPQPTPVAEVTEDRLLGGRVLLRQPRRGYRAGLDAALLAAACDAAAGARVLEAGCGPGAALLQAAIRRPDTLFTGVERAPEALALARENLRLNGLEARAAVLEGDVTAPFHALGLPPFDAVLANPPYFDDPTALRAPDPAKRGAWIAEGGLAAWAGFLLKAVREGATITVIHRADRLADILGLLAPKAGSFQVRPVQPFAEAPAKRVIVRAVKTGRAPLVLLPPLVVHTHDAPGEHTPQAEAVVRGDAPLAWR